MLYVGGCGHYPQLCPATSGAGVESMWSTMMQTLGVGEQTQFITKGVTLYRAEITAIGGSALICHVGVV